MRAQRLGINSDNLYIFAENNLSIIEAQLESINPELNNSWLYSNCI